MLENFPSTLHVGGNKIEMYLEETWEELCRDPRGVLLMFEPPKKRAKYIMGVDSSEGVTGWSRATRVSGDSKIDNSVIEIFESKGRCDLIYKVEDGIKVPDIDPITKRQRKHYRDVQVAEFAAPCDPVEIARIANVLGRIYAGDEDDQCELILESWPGCGMLAMQELLRIGYSNLWHWEYFVDGPAEQTKWIGWRSSLRSCQLLWQKTRRHLMQRNVIIRSKFLVEEYANAEIDMQKMKAAAAYGYHDDRMQAANMALWACNSWAYDIERTQEAVTESEPVGDYQRYAPGLDSENTTYESWREQYTEDW